MREVREWVEEEAGVSEKSGRVCRGGGSGKREKRERRWTESRCWLFLCVFPSKPVLRFLF